VEESIRALLELKLIKKLANGYAPADRHLAAGKALRGGSAREHSKAFLRLALESLEGAASAQSQYSVTSFSVSERGCERIRKRLDALRAEVRELAETADASGSPGERVYALALQLFPCSQEDGDGHAQAGLPGRTEPRMAIGTTSDSGNPGE
jgi:uncharacterized protein (TIGR02147 family)